ncbi:MAG: bacterial transcriptional activator domain-containing protein [Gemmiger sp.]|nr:bacterial transcriptional activator domain-containing protein [Gemmiger sp.]
MINTMNELPLKITMLGGFQLSVGGKPVMAALGQSRKATLLLQYLLLERERRVTHTELTDSIWGGESTANPDMALRAILHRFRNMADAEGVAALQSCIITHRGSYQWNNALNCEIDIYTMEKQMEQARFEQGEEEQIALFTSVRKLYKGRLLPASAGEAWVERRSMQLHAQYKSALYALLDIYKKRGELQEVVALCREGVQLDRFDEQLYMELILALKELGSDPLAQQVAQYAGELGYLHLSGGPSRDFSAAYRRMLKADRNMEGDIQTISQTIEEEDDTEGAFLCDYTTFKAVCKLHFRIQERYGTPVFLAVVTLAGVGNRAHPEEQADAMELLGTLLRSQLRRSDVAARYSKAQYVLLLNGLLEEDGGGTPLERIKTAFYRDPRHAGYALTYRLKTSTQRPAPLPPDKRKKK